MPTTPRAILRIASAHLQSLSAHTFDNLQIAPPRTSGYTVGLAKIISKLSPILGNFIELEATEALNGHKELQRWGTWRRQDPDFPDTQLDGNIRPKPGIEIKAWCPLATEVTARFRESQANLASENIDLALIVWLPEHILFGRPRVLAVKVVSALSVAEARDNHYFNPPDYLVVEPEDTSARTRNLRQTNTAGYKWQGDQQGLAKAAELAKQLGLKPGFYPRSAKQQDKVKELLHRFRRYRLDTNFAKIDRIGHEEIESFKRSTLEAKVHGHTVRWWARLLSKGAEADIAAEIDRIVRSL